MTDLLITGGLGLIGSAIADAASVAGYSLHIVDDRRACVVDEIPDAPFHDYLSVEEVAEGEALDPVRFVLHCAAPVGPVGILGRRVLDEMISSTAAAIDIAARHRAALVVFSSSEVYGTERPSGSLVVPDTWSHRTEYAVGKIVTEQIARRHYSETGMPTAIIRPWNVTGPRQAGSKGFVFPRMAAQAVAGDPITVYQPGMQRRAFMAVDDLAVGVLALLDRPSSDQGWRCSPLDAATPGNAIGMDDLAAMFALHPLAAAPKVEIVDPAIEHGPSFREAAAGSKLPPDDVAMPGTTDLATMVNAAMQAAHDRSLTTA